MLAFGKQFVMVPTLQTIMNSSYYYEYQVVSIAQ